jgi:1-acyl-sn-glycerol-3-phosphate acyltransferase
VQRFLQRLGLYIFHVCIVRPVLLGIVGIRFRRRGLVPDGPCLVVSNHNSHLDAAVLMTLFPLRRIAHVHPVAAADYFGETWLKRTVAMMLMNGIPIDRQPAAGQDPLEPIVRALQAGESLIFFPEGSRGEAGVVAPFRRGVGLLIRALPGLRVVPVFLAGTERIWPRGKLPVPLSIDVHVGRPRTYAGDEEPRAIAQRVRDDVLALAPIPPPAPGQRPAPPIAISICCADSELRGRIVRAVVGRLSRVGSTHGPSAAPGFPPPVRLPRLGSFFLRRLSRGARPRRVERFLELLSAARATQTLLEDRDTRFVVEEGSGLLELLAAADIDFASESLDESRVSHWVQYLTAQKKLPLSKWWDLIRTAPEIWLIHAFKLARISVPDLLVHVQTPSAPQTDAVYGRIAELLRRRHKVELLQRAGGAGDVEEIARQVETACLQLRPPQTTAAHGA